MQHAVGGPSVATVIVCRNGDSSESRRAPDAATRRVFVAPGVSGLPGLLRALQTVLHLTENPVLHLLEQHPQKAMEPPLPVAFDRLCYR